VFSLGGSNPYTSTDEMNKYKIYVNETIQLHNTNNTIVSYEKLRQYKDYINSVILLVPH